MSYLAIYLISIVVLYQIVVASGFERVTVRDVTQRHSPSLTAITVGSNIHKREGDDYVPKLHCEHHYADHVSILSGANSRVATTSMKYKLPAVILEDIEISLNRIECSEAAISIGFTRRQAFDIARKTWNILEKFLLITSHPGCNQNGERAPYLVSKTIYDLDLSVTTFSVQRIEWKDAYDSMAVKFGMSHGEYKSEHLRLHEDLRRRQAVAFPTVSYPSALPSTPTANASAHNISYQVPANQELFSFSNSTGVITETVTVACQNCSLAGTIEITEGEFTVGNSTVDVLKAVDFLQNGYFKAVANGLQAHIALDTTLSLSNTQSFDKTLATITLPGFQIPGIAAVGLIFTPHITGSLEIIAELDFNYGFDLKIPDNSSITVDIANLTQSSSHGFNDAQITPIILTASSPEISLDLGLGLRAELLLGIDILSGDGSMTAGIFLDMPYLTVSVSQLAAVNADCEPISGSSTIDGFLSHVFPNLTNVVPQFGINMGLQVGAQLDIADADVHKTIGTEATLAGTSASLPTACLLWDSEKNKFTSPTVTTSTASSTSTSTAGQPGKGDEKKSSGSRLRGSPTFRDSVLWWTSGISLLVTCIAFFL